MESSGPAIPSGALDIQAILEIAPHRYPFLMIDRVLEYRPADETVVGIKNVSINEPYFQGHFPGRPLMPGVLQIETMAQLGGLFVMSRPEHKGMLGVLAAVDEARFRRNVVPGDQLRVEAKIVRARRGIVETRCQCLVDGEVVSEATIKFAIVPREAATQEQE